MKTILYGRVTQAHLDMASLIAGIEPTSYLTNGKTTPPASNLETEVMPEDPMVGDAAQHQNHARLAIYGEALICIGRNDHLVEWAEKYGMPIYYEP